MKAAQASGFFPAAREMIHTISPTTARRKWPKMTGGEAGGAGLQLAGAAVGDPGPQQVEPADRGYQLGDQGSDAHGVLRWQCSAGQVCSVGVRWAGAAARGLV